MLADKLWLPWWMIHGLCRKCIDSLRMTKWMDGKGKKWKKRQSSQGSDASCDAVPISLASNLISAFWISPYEIVAVDCGNCFIFFSRQMHFSANCHEQYRVSRKKVAASRKKVALYRGHLESSGFL